MHGSEERGSLIPAGAQGRFGRMFSGLPPRNDFGVLDLAALADAMNCQREDDDGDNAVIPAGFTFLGQFLDHDLTFDPTPLGQRLADPNALVSFRTPPFGFGLPVWRRPQCPTLLVRQ